jgi:hypothetical protein
MFNPRCVAVISEPSNIAFKDTPDKIPAPITGDNFNEKFNKTFLNYKVDGDSFEGVNVGIICREDSFPTYLFIAPDSKVIDRIEGTMSPEGLVQEANFVLSRATE